MEQKHLSLVHSIAWRIVQNAPASIEVDDLAQAGFVGLLKAGETFDPDLGVPFDAYAAKQIRWAMLDEVRSHDWMSRPDRELRDRVAEAERELWMTLGRKPTDGECARWLDMPLAEFHANAQRTRDMEQQSLEQLQARNGLDFLDTFIGASGQDPALDYERTQQRQELIKAISCLTQRQQQVLQMSLVEEMDDSEIAAVLGMSASSMSHMRKRIVLQLRTLMHPEAVTHR